MCAYQVVSWPMPVLTCTSHRPAHDWSVRTTTVPDVAASTGVPQATDRSVPVCHCAQWTAPTAPVAVVDVPSAL